MCRHPLRKSKMRYMNYKEFIHPEDEAAMRNLEAVPGFDVVARFILEHFTEDLMHGLYMAQNVRLSPATSALIAVQSCDGCNSSGESEVVTKSLGILCKVC